MKDYTQLTVVCDVRFLIEVYIFGNGGGYRKIKKSNNYFFKSLILTFVKQFNQQAYI